MIHREKKRMRSDNRACDMISQSSDGEAFYVRAEKESMLLAVVPRRNLGRESEAKRDEVRRRIAMLRYASPILPSRGCGWNAVVREPGCHFRDSDGNSARDVTVYVIIRGSRRRSSATSVRGETLYRFHSRGLPLSRSLSLAPAIETAALYAGRWTHCASRTRSPTSSVMHQDPRVKVRSRGDVQLASGVTVLSSPPVSSKFTVERFLFFIANHPTINYLL